MRARVNDCLIYTRPKVQSVLLSKKKEKPFLPKGRL